MVALNRFFQKISLDLIGFSTSALCAVHCLVFPLLVFMGTLGTSGLSHNHYLENIVLGTSAVLGVSSLFPAYLNHHHSRKPLVILATGLLIILVSRLPLNLVQEALLTTAGAVTIAFSHVLNWKYCRTSCTPEPGKAQSGQSGQHNA